MTHYERIHAAMRGEQADRVPVMCQLSQEFMARNSGVRPFDMYTSAEGSAEAFFRMRERFHFDGILLNTGFSDDWRDLYDRVRVEEADGQEQYTFPDGTVYAQQGRDYVRLTPHGPATARDATLIDPEEIQICLDYSGRMALHRLVVAEGRRRAFSVHGETVSPFDLLVVLLGLTEALMALLTAPETCHALLQKYVGQSYAFAEAQMDAGVDTMKISSPFVGSSFISLPHYQEFVVPYERELVRLIHQKDPDMPVYTHTCGFIGDRLEQMASTGINGIECMDPPPLGDTELSDAKARVGRQLFLKGNMDSVNVLLGATPERMDAYVRGMISDGAAGGGYILSSACSVAPGVDPAILELLVPLAEKYGQY